MPPGLLDRLRGALAAVRPGRAATGEQPDAGPPTPEQAPAADAPRAAIFVTVFGLSTAALEEVLEVVMREGRNAPVSPVFLTDSLDFKPFRERRLRFEYLPDGGRRQRFAPDLDWRAYDRRRYRLLGREMAAAVADLVRHAAACGLRRGDQVSRPRQPTRSRPARGCPRSWPMPASLRARQRQSSPFREAGPADEIPGRQ